MCDWDGCSDLCDRCATSKADAEWLDETVARLIEICRQHGWACTLESHSQRSEARYYSVARGAESLKVRVACHTLSPRSAADFSIVHPRCISWADATLDHFDRWIGSRD